jgi:hypothetical protein
VLARLIYGFRISVLFGLTLTLISSVIGIAAAPCRAISAAGPIFCSSASSRSGHRFPRSTSCSSSRPCSCRASGRCCSSCFFSWVALVGVVRAEFLRGRNFEYVRAARALGVSDLRIMFRHILPNAMVATLTFLPFILSGSITTLTALDFLGLGLPGRFASLGELLAQGKENLQRAVAGADRLPDDLDHAVAADLHRRGGARCLRPAQGGGLDGRTQASPVKDLSVAFRSGDAGQPRWCDVSFDRHGRNRRACGRKGSGKSVSALSVLQAAALSDRLAPLRLDQF